MIFLAVAVATALIYACWVVWVPLLPTNLYVPLLDLGKITGYRWPSAISYLLIVLGLYALYAIGYRAIREQRRPIPTWWIFVAGAVFAAELVWAYPATAVDVFGYIAHGRVLALHGANPFIVAPDAYPSDAIIPFLAFPNEPSQYGPLWVIIGFAFAKVASGDLLTEILLYKGLAAFAQLGGAALIYGIAARLSKSREMAQASAYLYLWNPTMQWEMIGNAHNDGLMMFFGLAAVWLFVARYDLLVIGALAAGALVKVPIAIIAPILFISIARRSWLRAIESALLGLALAVAVYRPLWEGPQTLTALRRTDLFTASFGSVLRLVLEPWLGLADATAVARTVSLSAFAFVAVFTLLLTIRARGDVDVLHLVYVTLLAAVLLLTTWFQAWYVVWPLALGAALADSRRHLEVALLSLGGLLQYFVFIYLWVMGLFPPRENIGVQGAAYLAIVGPLVIGVAVTFVRGNRNSFAGAHGRVALC